MNMYEYRDLLAHEADEQSSQQIELQPTTLRPTSTLGSTLFRTQQQSFIGECNIMDFREMWSYKFSVDEAAKKRNSIRF